jgi:Family of unknown function (DUF5681)
MSFSPGKSGNPGGRPKGIAEVRELARKHTKDAITTLAELMNKAGSEQARIMAANSLLDRGWGKPTQPTSGDENAPPIMHEHRSAVLAEIARLIAARRGGSGGGGAK